VAVGRRPTREASRSGRAWGSRRMARYEERTARSYGFHPVERYALPVPNVRLCAEVPCRLVVREGGEVDKDRMGQQNAGNDANDHGPRPRKEWIRLPSPRHIRW
jgi:hypothetical protein